jgi:hypothetical protein
VQHDCVIEPLLPLDSPEGSIYDQPLGEVEDNDLGNSSPCCGPHSFPQTVHDGLAVRLFAAEQGFAVYPPSTRDGPMQLILYDEANDRLFKVVVKDHWSIDRAYIGRDF